MLGQELVVQPFGEFVARHEALLGFIRFLAMRQIEVVDVPACPDGPVYDAALFVGRLDLCLVGSQHRSLLLFAFQSTFQMNGPVPDESSIYREVYDKTDSS